MSGPGFAVIDFETTGLMSNGSDRVIEVAVVHVTPGGEIEDSWDTLVNPGRDLGPQHIHQIHAIDAMDAPSFEQIADRLIELLDGRVLVAHNARFDMGFLRAELGRIAPWVSTTVPALCTMQLARTFLPGSGRSLADCCAAYDIELDGAHRAAADARATARLLASYIDSSGDESFWADSLRAAATFEWPAPGRSVPGADVTRDRPGPLAATLLAARTSSTVESAVAWRPRPAAGASFPPTAHTFLERITNRLPESAGTAEQLAYLGLLDRCLLDHSLSEHEARALVALAQELGIDRGTCEELHLDYFYDLTRSAWSDGDLSERETADLIAVADVLDLPTTVITAALGAPSRLRWSRNARHDASAHPLAFALAPGDIIVLTGEMTRPRSLWENDIRVRGYVPGSAVTKKVSLVVAADTDSLSGKARKARDYGIPIVDEATLSRLL